MNAKQNLEHGSAGTLNLRTQKMYTGTREPGNAKAKPRSAGTGHAGTQAFQERAPISANMDICSKCRDIHTPHFLLL